LKLAVQYPADGFVYLYPRNCTGKFVLLQMVSRQSDPDDKTVQSPTVAIYTGGHTGSCAATVR
jgi:hypothetical protein